MAGTTTSNQHIAPGSTSTTPPPLRRLTTSIPARAAGIEVDDVEAVGADPSTSGGRRRLGDDDPRPDVGQQVGGVKVGGGAAERLQREVGGVTSPASRGTTGDS